MAKQKTVEDFVQVLPKELDFQERARRYEQDIKPLVEKWGVAPWAGLQSTNEMIAAVPMLKDMWPKEDAVSAG